MDLFNIEYKGFPVYSIFLVWFYLYYTCKSVLIFKKFLKFTISRKINSDRTSTMTWEDNTKYWLSCIKKPNLGHSFESWTCPSNENDAKIWHSHFLLFYFKRLRTGEECSGMLWMLPSPGQIPLPGRHKSLTIWKET